MSEMTEIISFELYKELTTGSGSSFSPGTLRNTAFKDRISEIYLSRSLSYLSNKNLANHSYDEESGEEYYWLTDTGIEFVENLLDNSAVVARWEKLGIDGFMPDTTPPALPTNPLSADDRWAPLPIDRSTDEYRDALQAIEEAIAEVGKSNGYPTEYPDERDSILFTLKSGLEALQQPSVTATIMTALLIEPLMFLAGKFSEAAIGVAAEKALDLVLKLTGLG
jgi:hypothetical protein